MVTPRYLYTKRNLQVQDFILPWNRTNAQEVIPETLSRLLCDVGGFAAHSRINGLELARCYWPLGVSRTHRLSNVPPPTLPAQKIVQEAASPDHRRGGIVEKLHVGEEAAKAVRHDPERYLANTRISAQTIVEYHLAFIHFTPAVWALQVLCQRKRTIPNEDVGGQDLFSRQCGGLRKVDSFRVDVHVQRSLPPNTAVCVAPVLADLSVDELIKIGVHDRHQHHAEAPFVVMKQISRVRRRIYLDMFPIYGT